MTMTYGQTMDGGWIVTVWQGDNLAYMTGVHEHLRSAIRDADLWMTR